MHLLNVNPHQQKVSVVIGDFMKHVHDTFSLYYSCLGCYQTNGFGCVRNNSTCFTCFHSDNVLLVKIEGFNLSAGGLCVFKLNGSFSSDVDANMCRAWSPSVPRDSQHQHLHFLLWSGASPWDKSKTGMFPNARSLKQKHTHTSALEQTLAPDVGLLSLGRCLRTVMHT